jgi:c(7)-type cytochrome triheme protein
MRQRGWAALLAAAIGWMAGGALGAEDTAAGKAVYDGGCIACHGTGVLGAPKLGDPAAWRSRVAGGLPALVTSARAGKGSMPPKGGNAALTDEQLGNAISYMVAQSGGFSAGAGKAAAAPAGKVAAPAPAGAAPKSPMDPGSKAAVDAMGGKAVYDSVCVACHATGVLGAPKLGDVAAWKARIAPGLTALVANARDGKGSMPPKGGNPALTEEQLVGAVMYMMYQSGGPAGSAAAPAMKPAAASAAAPGAASTATPARARVADSSVPAAVAAPPAAPAPAAAAAAPPVATAAVTQAAAAPANVNSFNRLLRPSQRNRPPTEDQIHDPGNDGTVALQAPLTAFNELARSNAGNRVDWVKSLREAKISPRADRLDPKAVPAVMDLNIVREVKGSMPDVVYPHKQHTEWLDCSNCHPAIFKPQKGANQISMAAILLGQACGVCHGKVAFPVSECRLCHSKSKATATAGAVPVQNEAAPK